MSEEKLPPTPTERRYEFSLTMFLQLIIFLLGAFISRPVSEQTGLDQTVILVIIAVLSFGVYLLPRPQTGSSDKIRPIPPYWNTRINALARLRLQAQLSEEPLRATILRTYIYGLEINYEAALLEGREALANRFRELIDKYEAEIKKD